MMRKIVALLLAAVLFAAGISAAFAEAAPASVPENWYMTEALNLADAMGALADNEAYVELFIGMGEDNEGFADQMAALKGLTPDACNIYLLRTDALESLAANYQMDEFTVAANRDVMENLLRRMNMNLPGLLNTSVGGSLWMAIASALTYTETFIMPEDFAPQAVLLLYGDCEAAVLKERSPSCGSREIYDGTFSRKLIAGDGVTAELLKANGIAVYGESEVDKLWK